MNRRGFLGAILAGVSAPAIVKASSLMPIVAPKIWTPDFAGYMDEIRVVTPALWPAGDFTIEAWIPPMHCFASGPRRHAAFANNERDGLRGFIDGRLESLDHPVLVEFKKIALDPAKLRESFPARVDEFRVTTIDRTLRG